MVRYEKVAYSSCHSLLYHLECPRSHLYCSWGQARAACLVDSEAGGDGDAARWTRQRCVVYTLFTTTLSDSLDMLAASFLELVIVLPSVSLCDVIIISFNQIVWRSARHD